MADRTRDDVPDEADTSVSATNSCTSPFRSACETIAGTNSCQAAHLGVQLSGTVRIRMDDGTERDIHAGELAQIPPGHDGWVVGNEPVVFIDITGMESLKRQSSVNLGEWTL